MELEGVKKLRRNIELYRGKDFSDIDWLIDWLSGDLLFYLDRLENRVKKLEEEALKNGK